VAKAVYGSADPIAAIATTLGQSALTVVRTSGEGSLDLLRGVFSRPERLGTAAGGTIVRGWIRAPDGEGAPVLIDEVLVSVYRRPRSYTGEEGADLSCHGGMAAGRAVLAALKAAGFREALPGEFTFRAFMNGKLDLTRAESVMEIVAARTDTGREHAVGRLSGVLEREIRSVQALLVDVLARAELFLDYSEDEAGDGAAEDEREGVLPGRREAGEALERLRRLSAAWSRERLYQEGALVVIAGRPNAGKSSLFNLLLREERSIVTEIPGTTRDWIEAGVSIAGIPVRLVDTAGLRAPSSGADPVERIGMARSRDLLSLADLVIYLIDGLEGMGDEDRAFQSPAPVLTVWNKIDAAPLPALPAQMPGISAKTGAGLEELCRVTAGMLEAAAGGAAAEAGAAPGTLRQKELVDEALGAVEEALAAESRGEPLDIIAASLRNGINALGEITGEVSTADILEAMFSKFCVGK
jgi:tRNA modification GTPase